MCLSSVARPCDGVTVYIMFNNCSLGLGHVTWLGRWNVRERDRGRGQECTQMVAFGLSWFCHCQEEALFRPVHWPWGMEWGWSKLWAGPDLAESQLDQRNPDDLQSRGQETNAYWCNATEFCSGLLHYCPVRYCLNMWPLQMVTRGLGLVQKKYYRESTVTLFRSCNLWRSWPSGTPDENRWGGNTDNHKFTSTMETCPTQNSTLQRGTLTLGPSLALYHDWFHDCTKTQVPRSSSLSTLHASTVDSSYLRGWGKLRRQAHPSNPHFLFSLGPMLPSDILGIASQVQSRVRLCTQENRNAWAADTSHPPRWPCIPWSAPSGAGTPLISALGLKATLPEGHGRKWATSSGGG